MKKKEKFGKKKAKEKRKKRENNIWGKLKLNFQPAQN